AVGVMIGIRGVGEFAEPIRYSELVALVDRAAEVAPAGDLRAESYLAGARAWLPCAEGRFVDADVAADAVATARRYGEATLESGVLDAAVVAALNAGHPHRARALWRERVELLPRLPRHQPSSAPEIWEIME